MKKIFSIILASIAFTSCVDTVILPDNKTVDEDYWQKKDEVSTIVGAAYAQLKNAELQRNLVVWSDFRSDEMVISSSIPASATYKTALSEIYSMNMEPTNTFTSWYPLYSAINYCNLVLQKAEPVMSIDPNYTIGDYQTHKAQVLGLRALCYFYLVRVFRDVPVTPEAYLSSEQDFDAPQAAPDSVLQMCITDLKEAEQYAVANNTFDDWRDRGYLNKDGIRAVLADIYLWLASVHHSQEYYEECVNYCDEIIAAKKASHVMDRDESEQDYYLSAYNNYYDDIYGTDGQNAEESIFEIQFNSKESSNVRQENNQGLCQMLYKYNSNSASTGYLKASKIYAIMNASGSTANIFKNTDDQRLWENTYDANNSSSEQFDIRKLVAPQTVGITKTAQQRSGSAREYTSFSQNWIVYRLTDIMLMKAEALVQLDKGEEAFALVKAVNDRALPEGSTLGLNYNTYKEKMETLVLMERARELCFEGKRWFDLLRYNYRHVDGVDYNSILANQDTYVANYDEMLTLALQKYPVPSVMKSKMPTEPYLYMPINEDEVELNTNLKQNPVYHSTTTSERK